MTKRVLFVILSIIIYVVSIGVGIAVIYHVFFEGKSMVKNGNKDIMENISTESIITESIITENIIVEDIIVEKIC